MIFSVLSSSHFEIGVKPIQEELPAHSLTRHTHEKGGKTYIGLTCQKKEGNKNVLKIMIMHTNIIQITTTKQCVHDHKWWKCVL